MKKLFIFGICLFVFMIAPNVEAREYDIDSIISTLGGNDYTEISNVVSGDTLTFNRNDNYIKVTYIYASSSFNDYYEIYEKDNMPKEYKIKSYEELTGKELPDGKKVIAEVSIETKCSSNCWIDVKYSLVDDLPKEVVYHNTYDAENNNPTSYYVEETDILLSDISRDGYKFLGWYTSPDFEEDTRVTMISSDEPDVLELYARWEKIEEDNVIDSNDEDIFTNPNTSSMFYIVMGIGAILILGTALVIVYKYKKL